MIKNKGERIIRKPPPSPPGLWQQLPDYIDDDYPFQAFVGGRRTGKTYSLLTWVIQNIGSIKMLYLRRMPHEQQLLNDTPEGIEGANPFKDLNEDHGWDYGFKKINDKLSGIYARSWEYDEKTKKDKRIYLGNPIGYGASLKGIASIRGISLSDVTDIFYDEFIKEKHVPKMRGEFDALMNAYTTINNNREFRDRTPVRLWMISNAEDIANPIFAGLGVINLAEKMVHEQNRHLYLPDRGFALHMLYNSEEFNNMMRKSAIARLTKGSDFYKTAIDNEWGHQDFSLVGWRSTRGMQCVCAYGDIFLYRSKDGHKYYACYAESVNVRRYNSKNDHARRAFIADWCSPLEYAYVQGMLDFESYEIKAVFLELFYNI